MRAPAERHILGPGQGWPLITTAMSTVIHAPAERVWRALTDPAAIVHLDEHVTGLEAPVQRYPEVGQHVRWRYRLGSIPIVLHDRPREVVPLQRLRASLSLGPARFDATWSLAAEGGEPDRTRLSLRLVASNAVPVVGGLLDRFAVRRLAAEFVDARLRAIQKWCENPS